MIVMCQTHRIFSNRSGLHSVSISQLRMTLTPSPSPSPCWSTVTPPPPSIHLAHLGAPFRYDQGSKYHSNNNDGDVSCLILLRNVKPVYGRNQKIQRQWTKFWSKLRLFCHHFPPLIVAKYLSTMSQWESKTMLRNMKLGSWRNPFSTFFDNFKMTFRKVTLTATIVNEKKFWQVPQLNWHVSSPIWAFFCPQWPIFPVKNRFSQIFPCSGGSPFLTAYWWPPLIDVW